MHRKRNGVNSDLVFGREGVEPLDRQEVHTIPGSKSPGSNKGISSSDLSLTTSSTSFTPRGSPRRAASLLPFASNALHKKMTRPIISHYHDACRTPPNMKCRQNWSTPSKSTIRNFGKNVPIQTQSVSVATKLLSSRVSHSSSTPTKEKISPSKSMHPNVAHPEQHTDLDCSRAMHNAHRSMTTEIAARRAPQSARGVKKALTDPRSSKSATELRDSLKSSTSSLSLRAKTRTCRRNQVCTWCDAHTQTVHNMTSVSTLTEYEHADCSTQTDTIRVLEPLQCSHFTPVQPANDTETVATECESAECPHTILRGSPAHLGPWSVKIPYTSSGLEFASGDQNTHGISALDSNFPKSNSEYTSALATPTASRCNSLGAKYIDEIEVKRTMTEVISVSGKTNFFLISSPQKNCITTRISPVRSRRPFFRCITENDAGLERDSARSPLPMSSTFSPLKDTPRSPEQVPCSRVGAISPVLELNEIPSSSNGDKLQEPKPQRKFHRRRLEHCRVDDVACEYPTFSEKCSPIVVPHPEAIDEEATVVFVDMKARRLEEIIKLSATRERTAVPTVATKCYRPANREFDHSEGTHSTSTTGHYVGSTEGTEEHAVAFESEPQSLEEDEKFD